MKSTTKRRLLRLLGPVLLLVVIYKIPNRYQLWELARTSMGTELVLAILLNLAAIALKVVRWQSLLRTRGIHYSFSQAWIAFSAVLYIGLLTPGRVGDVLRVRYLRRDVGATYADGLASIVVDRICDIYVLLGFVAVGIARFSTVLVGDLGAVTWSGVAVGALAPLLVLIPGVGDRLMTTAWNKLSRHDAAGDGMERFLDSLRTQTRRGMLAAVPLTIGAFLVNYAQGWLLVEAMNIEIGFLEVISLLALASLAGLLPVSVSGVGVRELLFAVIFPVLGLSAEVGVGYGLMVFAVIYVPLIVFGFITWQIWPLPLDDLIQRAENQSSRPAGE